MGHIFQSTLKPFKQPNNHPHNQQWNPSQRQSRPVPTTSLRPSTVPPQLPKKKDTKNRPRTKMLEFVNVSPLLDPPSVTSSTSSPPRPRRKDTSRTCKLADSLES